MVYMPRWSSEVNFWESVFPFNHLGPKYQTHVVKSGAESLYPLSHLTGLYDDAQVSPAGHHDIIMDVTTTQTMWAF